MQRALVAEERAIDGGQLDGRDSRRPQEQMLASWTGRYRQTGYMIKQQNLVTGSSNIVIKVENRLAYREEDLLVRHAISPGSHPDRYAVPPGAPS